MEMSEIKEIKKVLDFMYEKYNKKEISEYSESEIKEAFELVRQEKEKIEDEEYMNECMFYSKVQPSYEDGLTFDYCKAGNIMTEIRFK